MHRRRSALAALALAAVLHVALVALLLQQPTGRRDARPGHEPVPTVLRLLPLPPRPAAPPVADAAPRKQAPERRGRAPASRAAAAPAVAVHAAPEPAQAAPAHDTPASGALPSLLDSEATRRAVRQAARQTSMAERAASASGERAALRPDERLGQEIAKGAVGDCLKGEYVGGGMGLLSLPFWLAAEARGKCRR